MKTKIKLLGILTIGIVATILMTTPIADAVKAQGLSKAAQTLKSVIDIQENLLPALQVSVDTAQSTLDAIMNGENLQIDTVVVPYAYEQDVTDVAIFNIPEDQEGVLEKISCSVQQAPAWADVEDIRVFVNDTATNTTVCDTVSSTDPESGTAFNDDNDTLSSGESTYTITCDSDTDDSTEGVSEGCAGNVIFHLKVANIGE